MARYGSYQSSTKSEGYGRRRGEKSAGQAVNLRLTQLMVCLIIFSAVYVTKGVFPYKIQRLSQEVSTLVSTSVDLGDALADFGAVIGSGESVLEELGEFCVAVFGVPSQGEAVAVSGYPMIEAPVVGVEPQLSLAPQLSLESQIEETSAKIETVEVELPAVADSDESDDSHGETEVSGYQGAIMAVGQVYIAADDGLRELPASYTYDMLSLGGMERTTPVLGVISSGFGYRIHPLSGVDALHSGVDIAADIGDPIYAFSGGVVEYIGYSETYGNYFRIDHGNGVQSFYAHCNEIFVSKGDTVALGEQVAEVGETGNVTGPHLHLELLCNGIHIDPALYIDSL